MGCRCCCVAGKDISAVSQTCSSAAGIAVLSCAPDHTVDVFPGKQFNDLRYIPNFFMGTRVTGTTRIPPGIREFKSPALVRSRSGGPAKQWKSGWGLESGSACEATCFVFVEGV